MRAFRITMGLLALIPLLTGALELVFGTSLLAPGLDLNVATHRVLDSNLRFFGGVWLGLGVCLVWCLFDLRSRAPFVSWLWGFIFIGGVGRAVAMVVVGVPLAPFVFFTALELVGAPLFVWWLNSLTRRREE